jgi:hypothetical protein
MEAAPGEKATAASGATAPPPGAPFPCASGVPQSPQKRSVAVTSDPHFGQEDITLKSYQRSAISYQPDKSAAVHFSSRYCFG